MNHPILDENSLTSWNRTTGQTLNHILDRSSETFHHPLALLSDYVDEVKSPVTKSHLQLLESDSTLQETYAYYSGMNSHTLSEPG